MVSVAVMLHCVHHKQLDGCLLLVLILLFFSQQLLKLPVHFINRTYFAIIFLPILILCFSNDLCCIKSFFTEEFRLLPQAVCVSYCSCPSRSFCETQMLDMYFGFCHHSKKSKRKQGELNVSTFCHLFIKISTTTMTP